MNELIDEIAFEAGCHRHKYWNPKHPDLEGYIISQEALDKFAELIIRECTGLVQGVPTDTMGYHTADQKIKQHFGVEDQPDEIEYSPTCGEDFSCPRCGIENPTTSCGIPDCGLVTGVE